MKAYKNILVATDLSEESKTLTDRAKAIAEQCAAKLSLVHILPISPMLYGPIEFALPPDEEMERSMKQQAHDGLVAEGQRLGISKEDLWLEDGDTAEGLSALVQKLHVDLLILGTHKHRGLGYLFGSTSNAMLHLMPCDVLTIRMMTAA